MAGNSADTVKSAESVKRVRRLFCFSDIHANLPALVAVYKHALVERKMDQARGDHVVILGDMINYGGNPGAVIDFIQAAFIEPTVLVGNHERYAHNVSHDGEIKNIGDITEDTVAHGDVLTGIEQTLKLLTPEQRQYVMDTQNMFSIFHEHFMVSHTTPGSLEDYVYPNSDVSGILEHEPKMNFIMGHSHIASLFVNPKKGDIWKYNPDAEWEEQLGQDWRVNDEALKVRVDYRDIKNFLLVCPSVGKPRADECTKAGYAIIDFEEQDVGLFRVPYDFKLAAANIIANGMPEIFASHVMSAL